MGVTSASMSGGRMGFSKPAGFDFDCKNSCIDASSARGCYCCCCADPEIKRVNPKYTNGIAITEIIKARIMSLLL